MAAVRKVQPGCYIDPTCGMWLSPWWLCEADSIWGPVSGDVPSAIVPSPIQHDSTTTTRDGVFRIPCEIIKVPAHGNRTPGHPRYHARVCGKTTPWPCWGAAAAC